jgi:hypothetical protein
MRCIQSYIMMQLPHLSFQQELHDSPLSATYFRNESQVLPHKDNIKLTYLYHKRC